MQITHQKEVERSVPFTSLKLQYFNKELKHSAVVFKYLNNTELKGHSKCITLHNL